MITNANAAILQPKRPEFEIHDSLLGDALERNKLTVPPRLMNPSAGDHPLSKPAELGDEHAT